MADNLPEPGDLRGKALAARLRARRITPDDERRAMLVVAQEYERLADAIEWETERGTLAGDRE